MNAAAELSSARKKRGEAPTSRPQPAVRERGEIAEAGAADSWSRKAVRAGEGQRGAGRPSQLAARADGWFPPGSERGRGRAVLGRCAHAQEKGPRPWAGRGEGGRQAGLVELLGQNGVSFS